MDCHRGKRARSCQFLWLLFFLPWSFCPSWIYSKTQRPLACSSHLKTWRLTLVLVRSGPVSMLLFNMEANAVLMYGGGKKKSLEDVDYRREKGQWVEVTFTRLISVFFVLWLNFMIERCRQNHNVMFFVCSLIHSLGTVVTSGIIVPYQK